MHRRSGQGTLLRSFFAICSIFCLKRPGYAAPKTTTLTFWTFQELHKQFWDDAVVTWNKANPNSQIVLKTDVYNYDEMHNKLLIALQSGVGAPDILVYHARSYKEINGDPLYDPNRHTRAQVLKWNPDGTPDFGIPIPDGKSD